MICPGWMLSAFATVTNRAMGVSSQSRVGRRSLSAFGARPATRGRRRRAPARVVPAGHVLARREPDAALASHVSDQVLDQRHPGGAPAHERMAREHEAAVLTVHAEEFPAPHLENP